MAMYLRVVTAPKVSSSAVRLVGESVGLGEFVGSPADQHVFGVDAGHRTV